MEVGWNVKLPVDVRVLHRCYPTSPAKQDGWGSFVRPSSANHLILICCNKGEREKKKMNEECFLEASNRRRDKRWSGSGQTAVLFNTSCCWMYKTGAVVPRWSWNLESYSRQFLTTIIGIYFPLLPSVACLVSMLTFKMLKQKIIPFTLFFSSFSEEMTSIYC